jgi:hypothetical protein
MNSIYIGTWNVLTVLVLKPGKIQELAEQTANSQLEQYKKQAVVEMA